MDWKSLEIKVAPAQADYVQEQLVSRGILEFAVTDPRELADFMNGSVYYDYIEEDLLREQDVHITIYTPDNEEGEQKDGVVHALLDDLQARGICIFLQTQNVQEEDWMNSWKAYYKPIPLGKNLLIKPSWEELTAEYEGRVLIEIDPSSSFGTGTHETTRLCLVGLEAVLQENDDVLDMGCGSGILSVGAMRLGAKHVTAVDTEQDAMRVTRENMNRNGFIEERYILYHGNVLADERLHDAVMQTSYDVITANIVANVILAMRPLFYDALKQNGTLIASGIILDRLDEVLQVYEENGFETKQVYKEGEWAAIQFGKQT